MCRGFFSMSSRSRAACAPSGICSFMRPAASAPKRRRSSPGWRVYLVARMWLAIFATVIAACFWMGSLLPAMLIGLPTFYGGFMTIFFGLTQHAGLAEDVLDHRLNTRTVHMNPLFRFLYWNM